MSRSVCPAAAVLAAAMAFAGSADAFNARNGMDVTDLGGGLFRVEYEVRINETDYWCAAADYAQRVLGADSRTRLYRASPPPRKRGQGITFTLDASQSGGRTGISTFGSSGAKDSLGIGTVRSTFCSSQRRLVRFF